MSGEHVIDTAQRVSNALEFWRRTGEWPRNAAQTCGLCGLPVRSRDWTVYERGKAWHVRCLIDCATARMAEDAQVGDERDWGGA